MNDKILCSEDSIKGFLRDELSDVEEDALEAHLSQCTRCRRRLEDSTAETSIWSDASEFLRDEPFDQEKLSDLIGASSDAESSVDLSLELQQIVGLLAPTDDPERLGRIARYEIAGIIGSGGMGIVLKALDVSLNRYVAIKVLAPHLASSGAARTRFEREAQAAAAVVNENVLAIHGVDSFNGLPYLVMPYIRGVSLETRLREQGTLPLADILRIGKQTASGLAAAHAQGLVHRDIKPSNILLTDGAARVAITDFGLARTVDDASLTRTGMIAGTPQYMSPEQARGDNVGLASDLFSLGSVIYSMCTGRPPFRAETSYAVLRRITDEEPRPIRDINPEIPEWLAAVVSKLHKKSAEERFDSAAEVAGVLEQCLAHVQQPTTIELPQQVKRLAKHSRDKRKGVARRRWQAVATVALLMVCLVVAVFQLDWNGSTDSDPAQTQASAATERETNETSPENETPQPPALPPEPTLPSATIPTDSPPPPADPQILAWDEDTLWREMDELDAALDQLHYSIDLMAPESELTQNSANEPSNTDPSSSQNPTED